MFFLFLTINKNGTNQTDTKMEIRTFNSVSLLCYDCCIADFILQKVASGIKLSGITNTLLVHSLINHIMAIRFLWNNFTIRPLQEIML